MTQIGKPQRVWVNDTEVEITLHDQMPSEQDQQMTRRDTQLVTVDFLMSPQEAAIRRWSPMVDGGLETTVRDDAKVIVRWLEDPGCPDRAFALVTNPFGPSAIRFNLDTVSDLDELIRLLSIPPRRSVRPLD